MLEATDIFATVHSSNREYRIDLNGLRCFIRVCCHRVSDSCGWAVPKFEFVSERTQLTDWTKNKAGSGIKKYQQEKNLNSLDGLEGISTIDS